MFFGWFFGEKGKDGFRDLEEMATIVGCKLDHATIQRWVITFSILIDTRSKEKKKASKWQLEDG